MASPTEMSVLQWNVWFKQDIRQVTRFIEGLPYLPTVFTAQELTLGCPEQTGPKETAAYVAQKLGYNMCGPQYMDVENWQQANAIFSTYHIAETDEMWLYEPDADEPDEQYRGLIKATLDIDDTPVDVWTTQMRFFREGEEPDLTDDPELQKLLGHIDQKQAVGAGAGHLIVTGDLNMTPDTGDRETEITKRLNNIGPDNKIKTWSTKYYDYAPKPLTKRYDFIYASQGLEVINANVLYTSVSDHLPLLGKLAVTHD